MRGWRRYLSCALLLLSGGCSLFQQTDHFGSYPVTYDQLTGWPLDAHAQGLQTFVASCQILAKTPRERSLGSGISVSKKLWADLCAQAMLVTPGDNAAARQFFEARFVPYRVTNNGKDRGLFTGYYEPVLYGSLRKQGDYKYPLYLPPPELANGGKISYTRSDIDHGVLARRGLELVWVDDPVMLFFLQIQGSGRIRLIDGSEMPVGYAGQNGYPYASLGKIMGDEGLMSKDDINFFTLRKWLYEHPDKAFAMMDRNPSYVFFKRTDRQGAVGAVGAVLTPQRSLAVDNKYIPYGLPLFMETDLPVPNGAPNRPFNQLLVAQDTGGAIRGPVRGDVFFGGGADAEFLAGYMKGHGVYSLLVPKEIASQLGK